MSFLFWRDAIPILDIAKLGITPDAAQLGELHARCLHGRCVVFNYGMPQIRIIPIFLVPMAG